MKKFGFITLIALCILGCDPIQNPKPATFDRPTWEVNTGIGFSTMTLVMALPSDIVGDTTDLIGVFTNDDGECLAVTSPIRTGDSLLLGFVTIAAPSVENNCYVKYYHASTRHMYTTAPSALVFDTDASIGTLAEPKTFIWNIIKKK